MKKNKMFLILCCTVCAALLTACSQTTATEYNLIATEEKYEHGGNPVSGYELADDIKIDGVLDEAFYETEKQMVVYKPYGDDYIRLRTAVHIASDGLLIAADVDEKGPVTWSGAKPTSYNSGIEYYISVYGEEDPNGNLFECDLTAHGEVTIRVWRKNYLGIDSLFNVNYGYDMAPVRAVKLKGGAVNSDDCTGYTMEYFIPYKTFGWRYRPQAVWVNPGVISAPDATSISRDCYIFGYRQNEQVMGWGRTAGYVFDRNGFVSNKITVQAEGGAVEEQYRRDWCIANCGEITFNVLPESGKILKSFMVNDVDRKESVVDGLFKIVPDGDINIVAEFSDAE